MTIELLSILFICLSGVCKSVQDTVSFNFEKSIFSGLETSFWYPGVSYRKKWKLDKVGYPIVDKKGKRTEKFLFSSTLFVCFTDAWHLFGMFRTVFSVLSVLSFSSQITDWKIYILQVIMLWVMHNASFHLFYSKILLK